VTITASALDIRVANVSRGTLALSPVVNPSADGVGWTGVRRAHLVAAPVPPVACLVKVAVLVRLATHGYARHGRVPLGARWADAPGTVARHPALCAHAAPDLPEFARVQTLPVDACQGVWALIVSDTLS
jgi:hypothetical protein